MGPVYLLPRRPTQLCVTSLLCPQLQGVISVQKLGLKTVGARKGTVAGLRAAPQRLPPSLPTSPPPATRGGGRFKAPPGQQRSFPSGAVQGCPQAASWCSGSVCGPLSGRRSGGSAVCGREQPGGPELAGALLAAPRLAQVGRAEGRRRPKRGARAALPQPRGSRRLCGEPLFAVAKSCCGGKCFLLEAVWGGRRGWVSLALGASSV